VKRVVRLNVNAPECVAVNTKPIHTFSVSNKQTILIQGAGGKGGLTITKEVSEYLKGKENFSIKAGYSQRHEQSISDLKDSGFDLVKCDLHDTPSINNCLKGVNCVVIIPPYLPEQETLCNQFIEKCSQAGVKQCFLISVQGAGSKSFQWAKNLMNIEERAMKSGMNFTILRCAMFYETFEVQKEEIKKGTLFLPTGENKFAPICIKDVGKFIGKLILNPEVGKNKVYQLTGPETLSGKEMANIFSSKLGRVINFVNIPSQEFKKKLKTWGFHDFKSECISELLDWYSKGNGNRISNDFTQIMESPQHSFETFAACCNF